MWLVAEIDGTIAACTGLAWQRWNLVFETCRSLTHPNYRGRGLGRILYERSLACAYSRPGTSLTIGWPRSRSMVELMSVGLARPLVITGHDGALNVAVSEREFHLCGFTVEPTRLGRVAPASRAWGALRPFLVDAVLAPLGLKDEPGRYPEVWAVGPPGGQRLARRGWQVSFSRDSADDSLVRTVQVTDIQARTHKEAAAGVRGIIELLPGAEYVSVCVLADKDLFIADLRELGFRTTAYLPAWFSAGERRYDCLLLCRSVRTSAPRCHDTHELIARLDQQLNR